MSSAATYFDPSNSTHIFYTPLNIYKHPLSSSPAPPRSVLFPLSSNCCSVDNCTITRNYNSYKLCASGLSSHSYYKQCFCPSSVLLSRQSQALQTEPLSS